MAQLVDQGAEEGAKGHDAADTGGAHPHRDGAPDALVRVVQAVELAPVACRPLRQHGHRRRGHPQLPAEFSDQTGSGPAKEPGIPGGECVVDRPQCRGQPRRSPDRQGGDLVALAVDALLPGTEAMVVAVDHGASLADHA
ncbi:MAG: hypothetical protein J0M16_10130 [Gammaproteobacteria bacterium]|nr:hypothetical protein [Gammaproteobacteria bacterium]